MKNRISHHHHKLPKFPQRSLILRRFTNNSNNNSKYDPTRNPTLSRFYSRLGLNANPFKIAGSGIVGGFIGAMCGVGGGVIMIPLLRFATTMTAHQIAGTSLVAVTVGSMVGGLSYLESGVVRIPIAFSMAVSAMLFSTMGAFATSRISGKLLTKITGICLLSCVPFVFWKADPSIEAPSILKSQETETVNEAMQKILQHQREEKLWRTDPQMWYRENYKYCLIGCVSGFLSGLIGIGGGVIMTTYMASATELTQHEAVATSLLAIIPAALIGSMTHYRLNHISTPVAIILATGCAVGMYGSSRFVVLDVPDYILKYIFCTVLAISSAKMLFL